MDIYSATAPALLYLLHPCSRAKKPDLFGASLSLTPSGLKLKPAPGGFVARFPALFRQIASYSSQNIGKSGSNRTFSRDDATNPTDSQGAMVKTQRQLLAPFIAVI